MKRFTLALSLMFVAPCLPITVLAQEAAPANCGRSVAAADLTGQWLLTLGSSQLEVDDPQLKAELARVNMAKLPLMPTLDKLDASISITEGALPPAVFMDASVDDFLEYMSVESRSQEILYMEATNNKVWFRYVPTGCPECPLGGEDLEKWDDFSDLKALAQLLSPIVSTLPGAEGAYGIAAEKLSMLSADELAAAVENCGADVARIIGFGEGKSAEGHDLKLYYNFQVASSELLVGVFRWQGTHEGTPVIMTRPAALSR